MLSWAYEQDKEHVSNHKATPDWTEIAKFFFKLENMKKKIEKIITTNFYIKEEVKT